MNLLVNLVLTENYLLSLQLSLPLQTFRQLQTLEVFLVSTGATLGFCHQVWVIFE